jgi:NAD(P)-dependent dehydrogenase (short-subunit alcohol dehydrogenase family)
VPRPPIHAPRSLRLGGRFTFGLMPVAVVTGGNRGIGREVVRQLVERGHTTVLGSRDAGKGERAAAELGLGDRVIPRELDVSDPASVDALAAWVADAIGACDVLVNNAAVDYDTDERAATADLARVRDDLETNLLGAWRTAQALLPLLRRSGQGRIVNVSSQAGQLESMGGGTPAYRISKTALNALTRMLADELRGDRVLVNSVCPGWVATDMGGPGGRPVAAGAAGVVWAATLPGDGPTGGFFRDGRPIAW